MYKFLTLANITDKFNIVKCLRDFKKLQNWALQNDKYCTQ